MEKIALFLAEGFEEIEALTVSDILRRAKMEVVLVSITAIPRVESSHGIVVETDTILSKLDFTGIDMIVLPGGMPGTRNLEACKPLMDEVEKFYQNGKRIAAICAAPSILGHRGMLQGKTACSFPEFESELTGANVVKEAAVRDGNIITSRGMGCAIPFALEILKVYKGEAFAEEMAEKIIWK